MNVSKSLLLTEPLRKEKSAEEKLLLSIWGGHSSPWVTLTHDVDVSAIKSLCRYEVAVDQINATVYGADLIHRTNVVFSRNVANFLAASAHAPTRRSRAVARLRELREISKKFPDAPEDSGSYALKAQKK